ncbi:MAG: 6-phosphogluconate dehydrogenase, NAD-binding [Planctomycetaceae bacterium]|nr:6-phosphogluconate dehydrogenase, NAD-binding [Planctomycetaceae bacterium]
MAERTIGLIGVGLVGLALAERLIGAKWNVVGFDLDSSRLDQLRALQGQVGPNVEGIFESSDVILLSLPTSQIAAGVIKSLTLPLAGKTVIDTTTGAPDEMLDLGQYLADRSARYLDATIAGSSAQVRSGEVIVMIGGELATVTDCDEIFRTFASRSFHVGSWGAGARMKLVVNLILGLNRAVLAEGLCFAERFGVDPRQALEVLRAGPAFSRVMDTKAGKMLDQDFTPQARLSQHLKDVRMILSAGENCDAILPLSMLHEQLLDRLDRAGFGELDNSAIVKAFKGD